MKVRTSIVHRQSIFLDEKRLRSLAEIFSSRSVAFKIEIVCSDGTIMTDLELENVLNYPNTNDSKINSISFSTNKYSLESDDPKINLIFRDQEGGFSRLPFVFLDVDGKEEDVIYFTSKLKGQFGYIRPNYWRFSDMQSLWTFLFIFSIFPIFWYIHFVMPSSNSNPFAFINSTFVLHAVIPLFFAAGVASSFDMFRNWLFPCCSFCFGQQRDVFHFKGRLRKIVATILVTVAVGGFVKKMM